MRLAEAADRPAAERLLARALDASVQREGDPVALSVAVDDAERAAEALAELGREGLAVAGFSLGQPSLDEVFLAITQRAPETEEVTA